MLLSLPCKKPTILHTLYINLMQRMAVVSSFTHPLSLLLNQSHLFSLPHLPFSMDTTILGNAMFFILCVSALSDGSIAENPSTDSRKLDYQDYESVFSPLTVATQMENAPGNIPIVNPTIPGTIPIVNPTGPSPPTAAGGIGPTPTAPMKPTPTAPTGPNPTGPIPTAPTTSGGPSTSGGSWCIASPTASQTALQVALDFACGYGGTDCSAIQSSGACYEPNTVHDHASYAFNNYYQKNPIPTSCVFGGAAQLASTDPSHGSCRFASSSSTPTTPTGVTPTIPMTPTMPTIPMTPPSMTTPTNPNMPGGNGFGSVPTGGNDYGTEPAGTPSPAGTKSANLLLFITINCLVLSVTLANHF